MRTGDKTMTMPPVPKVSDVVQLIPAEGWAATINNNSRHRETRPLIAWGLTGDGDIVPIGLDDNLKPRVIRLDENSAIDVVHPSNETVTPTAIVLSLDRPDEVWEYLVECPHCEGEHRHIAAVELDWKELQVGLRVRRCPLTSREYRVVDLDDCIVNETLLFHGVEGPLSPQPAGDTPF
jgi:hypothetical protein